MPEEPTVPTPELLNDFYAECEEHFGAIRQALLAIEQSSSVEERACQFETLFRNFHSIKGMMGIVGIASGEELTHRAEDYLREVMRKGLQIGAHGLDLLANTVQLLDSTVAASRAKQPFPDVSTAVAQFRVLVAATGREAEPAPIAPTTPDTLQRKIDEATARGLFVSKATFTPSPALNERGINVNVVRSRLTASGDIIQAAPKVQAQGAIAFEFFVAAADPPSDLPQWENDGVHFDQLATPSVTAPRRTETATPAAIANVVHSQVVRVELDRLDELMRIMGELIIQRARLEEQITRLQRTADVDVRGLQEVNLGFARQFKDMRDTVMRLRMVPIAEIFDRMPFVVRDLTRTSGKKVKLEIRGQHTELDKFVVDRLKEPLLHLVRNAVSHGVGDPQERAARGKPAEGMLTLSASALGETVVIEVADDGRGIDPEKVRKRAEQMRLSIPETMDGAAILELISTAGFSTRETADRAAGRGVGMTVVASTIRELGGTLFLDSTPAQGTRFTMSLPLTLLITDAFIVAAGGQKFAVPQNSIEQVVQIEEAQVKRMEQAELVSLRGTILPLVRLRSAFGFPPAQLPSPSVLISQGERGKVGLVVDKILGQRQIVVRSIRDPLIHVPGVVGATELGDGRPLLILDTALLARQIGQAAALASRATGGNGEANHDTNTRGVLHPV